MKRYRVPRKLSLVKFNEEFGMPPHLRVQYPFRKGEAYLFLGEIVNMPGHSVLFDIRSGKGYFGYHTENFVEIPEDET